MIKDSIMRYEIKSILKNKLTWIFLFILLVFGIMTVIELETKDFNQQAVKNLEWQVALGESAIQSEIGGFYLKPRTEEEIEWFDNYISYRQWLIDTDKYEIECYKNIGITEKEGLILLLRDNICQFNLFANPKEGNEVASKVFRDELNKYESILNLKKLPFNYEKLVGEIYSSDEEKNYIYNGAKINIEYIFYLLENNEKNLTVFTASPLTFLSIQLSVDQVPTIVIGILIVFFATVMIVECKKNKSMQLISLLPREREYIIKHYYGSIFISIIIILLVAFGIPFLILGIRHGFDGWKLPILVDPKGFSTFIPYEHTESYGIWGLGKAYMDYDFLNYNGIVASSKLVFWPMWKFLIAAATISFLKIVFLTLLGVGIGIFMKKNWSAFFMSIVAAIFYGISQYFPFDLKWNPFSLKSGWDITLGWTHVTWLNAIVLLVVSICILCIIMVYLSGKKEFD